MKISDKIPISISMTTMKLTARIPDQPGKYFRQFLMSFAINQQSTTFVVDCYGLLFGLLI